MQDRFGTELIAALPMLRRYALSLCRRRDMADDLVQTTVEKALAARTSYDAATRLLPWLFRILRNTWIDLARRAGTRGAEIELDQAPELIDAAADRTPDARVMLGRTLAALSTLSEEQREVIQLVCFEELSYAEAAAVLEIPTGTVMSRLARGRLALAERLGMK